LFYLDLPAMKAMRIFTFLFLLALFAGCVQKSKEVAAEDKPLLVVLSMDGFRWDYADKTETPNLDRIAASGVKTERMIPSFPTKTFPNHYTLATGLYPDHHGIVLNNFYDPETGRHYATRDRSTVGDGSFYGGEPIWVTAEKQGLKAASLFWVGSEAAVQGIRPSIWKPYQHKMPYTDRIDSVISWLERPPEKRPNLIMWYFDEPDGVGHGYGPDSPETAKTVTYLDSLVGVFVTQMEALPFKDQINFIVTSDHGMGNISEDRVVMMNDFLNEEWIGEIQGSNPIWTIEAAEGFEDEIAAGLAKLKHISWCRAGEVPERLHYGTNPRTLDFVVVADSAWSLFYDEKGNYFGGTHGFDNANRDMHTIFYATGPAFKNDGNVYPPFRNVSLYVLMCRVLGLEPATNDGDIREVEEILSK